MGTEWENFQERLKAKMAENYSKTAVEHMTKPKNLGSLSDADAHVSVSAKDGNNMEMWLVVRDEKVEQISFRSWGCGVTLACGSLITELVRGKTLDEALSIKPDSLIESLGGLSEDHFQCAELACLALKKVITEYLNLPGKAPGKGSLNKAALKKGPNTPLNE